MTLLLLQVTDTAHKIVDTVNHGAQQLASPPGDELRFGDLPGKGRLDNVAYWYIGRVRAW